MSTTAPMSETLEKKRKKVTTLTTPMQQKMDILHLLLKESTLMRLGKKSNSYYIANGRMVLTILKDGLQKQHLNQELYGTYRN